MQLLYTLFKENGITFILPDLTILCNALSIKLSVKSFINMKRYNTNCYAIDKDMQNHRR